MRITQDKLRRIIRNVIHESMDPATKRNLDNLEVDMKNMELEAIQSDEHYEKLEAKMDLDVTKPVGESKQVYSVRILEDFDFVYGYDQVDEKDLYWYIPKGRAYVCYATDPGYPAEYVLVSVERRRSYTRRLYIPVEHEDLERYESEGVLEYQN